MKESMARNGNTVENRMSSIEMPNIRRDGLFPAASGTWYPYWGAVTFWK
jgi:hypothetical protein